MRFKSRHLALIIVFAALYAVLSFVSLFPIIGTPGKFITLASILAPILGMMLGPLVGTAAVSVGGFLGWSLTQTGAFSFLSFLPSALTTFGSGLVYKGKRLESFTLYLWLFLIMAFYPMVGPAWLYPYYLWFQLAGLIILVSPLSSAAISSLQSSHSLPRLSFGIAVISLISTLIGQIAGSLMFEAFYWPVIIPQVEYWRIAQWQTLTFVYPLERGVITFLATIVGAPLIKALEAYGFEMGGAG